MDWGANCNKALVSASDSGNLEIVQLLLDRGADVHVNNDSALEIAFSNRHYEIVQLLLERGANTTVLFALNPSYSEIVNLLSQK